MEVGTLPDCTAGGSHLRWWCRQTVVDIVLLGIGIGIVSWQSAVGCRASVVGMLYHWGMVGIDVDSQIALDLYFQMNPDPASEGFEMSIPSKTVLPGACSQCAPVVGVQYYYTCCCSDRRTAHHPHC